LEAGAGWAIVPDGIFSELRTLPAVGVVHAWRVLRLLAVWASDSHSAVPVPFDVCGMEALERSILFAEYDEAIRYPLAVLARHLTPGVEPDTEWFGWACLCVAEWAISTGCAPEMGRSFIYAAARITGLNSYMAVARAVATSGWTAGYESERRHEGSVPNPVEPNNRRVFHDDVRSGSNASGGNP
jgi:hypothetical protein